MNIILYNDQGQEETLSGVKKLVTRGPDGGVEFTLGGGGGSTQSDMPNYFEPTPEITCDK